MFEHLIKSLTSSKYVKKVLKEQLKEEFTKVVLSKKQTKIVNELIDMIPVGNMNLATKEAIKKKIHEIGPFDYKDEYDNNGKELVVQEQEVVSPQIKIDTIEKGLDSKVKKYNGFTEKNPMEMVTYDETRKSYRIVHNGKYSRQKFIEGAYDKSLEIIGQKFNTENIKLCPINMKSIFKYKDEHFIVYMNNDATFFDVRHILNVLGIQEQMIEKKYKEFSKDIIGYCPVKNEFGGYFIREFISEETMYQIILSSNSAFSKSFKKDVSKILVQIRQDGQLMITDTGNMEVIPAEQAVKRKRRIKDAAGCSADNAVEVFGSFTSNISGVYLFTIGTVGNLREKMSIDDEYSDDCFVVKYGMTEDLSQRTLQHDKTFNSIEGCCLKFKFGALINEEYISKAEVDIKEKLESLGVLFRYKDMVELAIVTQKQLKELGNFYEMLYKMYGGSLKSITTRYETALIKRDHDLELVKEILRIEKEYSAKLLKAEQEKCDYVKKLYELEKEKNKYLVEIQSLKKQLKK